MVQQSYQILGDEDLNDDALAVILRSVPGHDQILFCSGFNFETVG